MIKGTSSIRILLGAIALFAAMAHITSCAPKAPPKAAVAPPPEKPAGPPGIYIEVNIPSMEMTVFEDGAPRFVKPVAIGSGVYPTPAQESEIRKIEWNPWWYPPPAEWAKNDKPTPPGPGNPLGLVKMALDDGILFHGTNKEKTVGTPASHGCMRMKNADAVEVAWYLQTNLSDKNDPSLKETYASHRKTTYVVQLNTPVPVGLFYKPVILRGNAIAIYPDFYKKIIRREAAIKEEILASGAHEECIDDGKVDEVAKSWPKEKVEYPVSNFLKPDCR